MALGVDLTTVGAICGIAASVWLIMRDVVPVAARLAPRVTRFVKSKHDERQKAKDHLQAERDEQAWLAQRQATFEAFERSVYRLRCMEHGVAEYHKVEWRRQIEVCKRDALRVLRRFGVKMNAGYLDHGPRIVNREAGSIIIDWKPSKWNLGRVEIVIFWHPNPSLTMGELYGFESPNGTIEHTKVLSRLLTDTDMEMVGWTYFEEWHSDYGYGDDEWISVSRWRESP